MKRAFDNPELWIADTDDDVVKITQTLGMHDFAIGIDKAYATDNPYSIRDIKYQPIRGISLCRDNVLWYVNIESNRRFNILLDHLKAIRKPVTNSKETYYALNSVVGYKMVSDSLYLYKYAGLRLPYVEDLYLALRVLYPSGINKSFELADIARDYLNIDTKKLVVTFKEKIDFWKAWIVWKLYEKIYKDLGSDMRYLYNKLMLTEHNLIDLTLRGLKIDSKELHKLYTQNYGQLYIKKRAVISAVGHEFNPDSNAQIVEYLQKHGLTSEASGDMDTLGALSVKDPVIEKLHAYKSMEYFMREVNKLKDAEYDGTIYGMYDFNAESFRVLSSEPNIQNMKHKHNINGQDINLRTLFIPGDPDYVFVYCDYNQVELRILAHLSEDPNLVGVFKDNRDLHAEVAKSVFKLDCPVSDIKEKYSDLRSKAKVVNYGVPFGIGATGLAKQLKIDIDSAQNLLRYWYGMFEGVQKFNDSIKARVMAGMPITNMFGVSHLYNRAMYESDGAMIRSATNWPTQSSAAIVENVSLNRVGDAIHTNQLRAELIMYIHDGYIYKVHRDDVERFVALAVPEFEKWHLAVPLIMEHEVIERWA